MESVPFEKFGIDKCLNENCNQQFTDHSIKLAVWLKGVIFLVQNMRYACNDSTSDQPLFFYHEKDINGYVGITCPKCQKTNLYRKSVEEVKQFKGFLSSGISTIGKETKSVIGNSSFRPYGHFPLNLRYYSPIPLNGELQKKFDIEECAFDPTDRNYFFDDIKIFIRGQNNDLDSQFCSIIQEGYLNNDPLYGHASNSFPVGDEAYIYWFREDQIPTLIDFENEKNERIFPRYHYLPELLTKAAALLRYNYQSDTMSSKTRFELKFMMRKYCEQVTTDKNNKLDQPPSFEDLLEKKKNDIISDPKMPGNFLEFLFLEPHIVGDFPGQILKHSEFLWVENNPLNGRGLPDDFIFGKSYGDFGKMADEVLDSHRKRVERIRTNQSKQYVQEFLKENLVVFLKKYEALIQSNTFSYAAIWELKESYLEKLYQKVNIGLRDEVPYVIYREGNSWKIVFDGKPFGGLTGMGFLWLYLTILHQPSPVYYTALHDTYVAKQNEDTDNQTEYGSDPDDGASNVHRRGHADFEQESYEKKRTENVQFTDQMALTYSGVLTKQYYADPETLEKYGDELEDKEFALEKARSSGDLEELEEKMDDLSSFLETIEKYYGIRKIKIKARPGEKDYKLVSSKFKDKRHKKIGINIRKNYRDAITTLKKIKDPAINDLLDHLSKHFRSEGGAFIYTPPEGFNWHLS